MPSCHVLSITPPYSNLSCNDEDWGHSAKPYQPFYQLSEHNWMRSEPVHEPECRGRIDCCVRLGSPHSKSHSSGSAGSNPVGIVLFLFLFFLDLFR